MKLQALSLCMVVMIAPCAFSQRENEGDHVTVEVVARKLFKNYSVHAFLDYSDDTIEWLCDPAPALGDIVIPLAMNEFRLISPKLRPVTKGIFLFGPGIRMSIYKGHSGKITIDGVDLNYEELKKVLLRLEHERAKRNDKMAEQAGAGQPATRFELKSEGSQKPKPESEGRSR